MAGIGFELRKLMQKETLGGMAQAYAFAGIIGSGPWVLSIVAILAIGMFNTGQGISPAYVSQFQVSVTYLMAASVILTSLLQLTFTRYAADRLFEKREALILPNLFGALTLTLLCAGIIAGIAQWLLADGSFLYRQSMLAGFVTLSGIWMVVVFASAIKAYRRILLAFFIGYGITAGAALGLRRFGLEGMLWGFVAGQACLFFALLALVMRQYPGQQLISFDFLRRGRLYPSLILTGLFYNIGSWIDKFIFWADPLTGASVVGHLRASPYYDLPIFLGYLSLIPGMAVFLIRLETGLAEQCERFYLTITGGGTLSQIEEAKKALTEAVQGGLLAMLKVQGAATLILLTTGDELLAWFGISPIYRPLLNINLVAAAIQLLLLAVLNVLFYLDQRQAAMRLCLLFALSNAFFSWLSLYLGPIFFGYGFALAVLLTGGVGLAILSRKLDRLEYETFMLQPATC